MIELKTIKICTAHQDYQVPLIYTFSWNHYEYWCPYCDVHEGMMGAGKDVQITKTLLDRKALYKKLTEDYIHAMGVAVCSATTWKGEVISPTDLPQEEKTRLAEIRKAWTFMKKAEEIK